MTVAILLDAVVAALLVATIVYAAILNRKLERLRTGKAELESLLASFHAATARAESGISALRTYADASHDDVEERRTAISGLHDDLDFLVGRAQEQADRLEALIRDGRARERPTAGLNTLLDRARDDAAAGISGERTAPRSAANARPASDGVAGATPPPWNRASGKERAGRVLR